jgi:hypothetical protein
MVTLFDCTAPVKVSSAFGRGILPPAPTTRVEYTAADAAWWAGECARREEAEFNAHLERLAFESACTDRYERCLPGGILADMDMAAVGAVG